MTVQSHSSNILGIRIARLVLSPLNVRKDDSDRGIAALAASIEAEGVLQNLAGYTEEADRARRGAPVAIVAGGRRWRALQLLLKQRKIKKDYLVPCLVTSKEAAIAISLAENADREPLHPADEFEAARALVDAGQSIEDVAARLRLEPVVVQRRLKLANVAPAFIALYRQGKLNLEHLMAFAVTDDHEKQHAVWTGLPLHARTAASIREALLESEVSSRDPVARFVGVKAYEKAGGAVRRDLFSEEKDLFLQDVDLLNRLARAKLDQHAERLKRDGMPWVDVSPRLDYADRAGYGRVRLTQREPNDEERAALCALEQELALVRAGQETVDGDDETLDALFEREQEIERARDTLREDLAIPVPEQAAKAGALLSIDPEGRLRVDIGLLKPEDAKLFDAQEKKSNPPEPAAKKGDHSGVLLQRFTALRTQALQAELAQNPEVALAAVVHRFVLNTFSELEHGSSSPLQFITPETPLHHFNKDLESTDAYHWLATQRTHLLSMLPKEPQALFGWILEQSHHEKLALLAFCAARTVDSVQKSEAPSDADGLAHALRMDLRKWWTPTAAGYFGSIRKDAVLRAVTESVSAEEAARIEKLKKGPLAAEAEKLLAGTGWLPEFVREHWSAPACPNEQASSS